MIPPSASKEKKKQPNRYSIRRIFRIWPTNVTMRKRTKENIKILYYARWKRWQSILGTYAIVQLDLIFASSIYKMLIISYRQWSNIQFSFLNENKKWHFFFFCQRVKRNPMPILVMNFIWISWSINRMCQKLCLYVFCSRKFKVWKYDLLSLYSKMRCTK